MPDRLFLRPLPGRTVRIPAWDPDRPGEVLPEEGAGVEAAPYWQRRIEMGDVQAFIPPDPEPEAVEVEAPPASARKPKARAKRKR